LKRKGCGKTEGVGDFSGNEPHGMETTINMEEEEEEEENEEGERHSTQKWRKVSEQMSSLPQTSYVLFSGVLGQERKYVSHELAKMWLLCLDSSRQPNGLFLISQTQSMLETSAVCISSECSISATQWRLCDV
jgi:hypothetical protein